MALYVNPTNVSAGGKSIQGVQSFDTVETGNLHRGAGDGDVYDKAHILGRRTVVSTITTQDLKHGVTVDDTGNTNYTVTGDSGLSAAFTVTNGIVTNVGFNTPHDGPATSTITVEHSAPDGSTSPITVS